MSRMHIFGSTCYGYVQNAKKLDARSKKGNLLADQLLVFLF